MKKYDVITIGSGLGALLSSLLLARDGKSVLMLEQHVIPGGYCTSYMREGFTFSVPSITHFDESGELYSFLESIDFFTGIQWVNVDNLMKCIYPDMEVVFPANNLEGCRENLKKAFPHETRSVDCIMDKISGFDIKKMRPQKMRFSSLVNFIRIFLNLRKNQYEFLKQYTKDDRLIAVLTQLWGFFGIPPKMQPSLGIGMLNLILSQKILYPATGYQSISDHLAKKLMEYGGEIRYRTKVSKILIRENVIRGVVTEEGEEISADSVISSADTENTYFELIGKNKLPSRMISRLEKHQCSESGFSLHLGTPLDLSKYDLKYGVVFYNESWEDHSSFYERSLNGRLQYEKDPIQIGIQVPSLFSSRLAPEKMHGLHALVYPVDRDYFTLKDRKNPEEYKNYVAKKNAFADILIKKIEKIIPCIASSIVVKDTATPHTFERYTGATRGAWYDSVFANGRGMMTMSAKTCIKNFYLTGVKAQGGGGLVSSLMGGLLTYQTMRQLWL